ncbi:MAG: Crp/Fnr family transcriptional regulator [Anaeroplasmataceae bacterium]
MRGSTIISPGDTYDYLFYLKKGIIEKRDGDKKIEEYHTGEYFDIAYINKPYEYTYVASIESNIEIIPINTLKNEDIYNILSNKLINLEKTNIILSEITPIKKIARYLLYKYKEANNLSLSIPYNKHLLASYLGISLSDLKEALNTLKIKNIVVSNGYIYNIINLSLLNTLIENEKESRTIL